MPSYKLPPDAWRKAIPEKLRKTPHFVGHHKKVPCHPASRRLSRVNDPATWGTFEEAFAYYSETFADPDAGVGFVFTDKDDVIAIDLDHVVEAKVDERTGLVHLSWRPGSEPIQALLRNDDTGYAEVSPSGTGVHIFIRGRLPPGVSHGRKLTEDMKLEVWDRARYVTLTGQRIPGFSTLAPNARLLGAVVDFVGTHEVRDEPEDAEPERVHEADAALTYLDPDVSYPEWIKVGMSLKAGLGAAGRSLWLAWCKRGSKYVPGEPEVKWDSFAGTGVGLGSLLYMAKEAGWTGAPRPPPNPDDAFAEYYVDGPVEGDKKLPANSKPDPDSDLPVIVPASQVKLANVNWLWKPRIAVGELGLMVGDPGIGKSLAAIDIAARITRGLPLPGEPADLRRPPKNVLYLNGEDHPEQTVRARLAAAGADLTRVFILQVGSPQIRLPSHLGLLDRVLRHYKDIVLAIFDPLGGILDPGLDPNSASDVRKALNPLSPWGARHELSPLVLHHMNKATEKSGIYRIAGSTQIVGTSRHVLVVSPDPEEEDDSPRRLVGLLKTNASKAPTYAFDIAERRIEGVDDPVGYVEWQGVSTASARSLTDTPTARRPSKQGDAAIWLATRLDSGEEVPARLIFEEGSSLGYGEQCLRRAAKEAGVVIRSLGPKGSLWQRAKA